MKKIVLMLCCVSVLFGMSGREVMQKQKDLQSTKSEQSREIMILINSDNSKEKREVKRKMRKDVEKDLTDSLIVFVKPSDVGGTALLNLQASKEIENQYLYTPALKKLQRIAQGSKKNYFMGTDFTYEDLSADKLENYNYKILKEEDVKVAKSDKKELCYVIEATPTEAYTPKTSYSKKILWVTKEHFYTKKVEFYGKDKSLIKFENSWEFVNPTGTVYRPLKVAIINKKENHKTVVMVKDLKINEKINKKAFTKRYLLNEEHMADE